jgi:hypothetical protein
MVQVTRGIYLGAIKRNTAPFNYLSNLDKAGDFTIRSDQQFMVLAAG